MKWKEIIHVRTFDREMKEQAREAALRLDVNGQDQGPERLEIWDGNNLDTEIFISILWNNDQSSPEKSGMGMTLAKIFSEYGWINHSVWKNRKTCLRKS